MLRSRRILSFSGRIQNYLLLLYLFFFIAFFFCGFFSVQESFVAFLLDICTFLAWTTVLFGISIIICAAVVLWQDRVFSFASILGAVWKIAAVFLCSFAVQFINQIISDGIVISG